MIHHIVGIDPGLVHTGLVRMVFNTANRTLTLSHEVLAGGKPEVNAVLADKWAHKEPLYQRPTIYIEGYKPRHHYGTDPQMIAAVNETRRVTGGIVIQNTGIKKVVKKDLMILLGVWSFGTVTHHQDLRSAARIALLGMMKDRPQNMVLADVVLAHLNGTDWVVLP